MDHKAFGDRSHIIYVNGASQDASTELGKLMHDFFCTKADDMNYKVLAEKVRYFKENEEGVRHMCKVLEDMRAESEQRGEQNATKVINYLWKNGRGEEAERAEREPDFLDKLLKEIMPVLTPAK